jgi:hypothetical protein
MPECAFCSHEGKLSREHITGKWMRELFPGKKIVSYSTTKGTNLEYPIEKLDWKAKVVCETCNNTWMSDIEKHHAKPVLTPLITGQMDIPIGLSEAHSIALFTFKTAVVLDHAYSRSGEPFFERTQRHEFRERLAIPASAQMWLCPYAGNREGGRFIPSYLQGKIPPANDLQMYVCTIALGHIAIQVVSAKVAGNADLHSNPSFEGLAVPFWPELQPDYLWPGSRALLSRADFISFANRWQSINSTVYL